MNDEGRKRPAAAPRGLPASVLLLALLLALLVDWSHADPLRAAPTRPVKRIALVAGNNVGIEGDVDLRFAQSDAERVATVLEELGEFSEVVRLEANRARDILGQLERLRQVIAGWKRDNQQVFFLFYYSGHADMDKLHLNRTILPTADLLNRIKSLDADLRVVIVDACQSGAMLRQKGLTPVAPLHVDLLEQLEATGLAVLASSSRGEAAQESEALQGSFFSSYLVTGLRGAADKDGDGAVSLLEAYGYATDRTMQGTIMSAAGIQHPTYEMKIVGKRDVVLTRPVRGLSQVSFQASTSGAFLVVAKASGSVQAEIDIQAGASTRLSLPSGDYLVKKRSPKGLRKAEVRLREGQASALSESEMIFVPYAALQGKGQAWDLALVARPRKRPLRTWGVVSAASALGALAAGATLELLAQKDFSEKDRLVARSRLLEVGINYSQTQALEQSGKRKALFGYLSLGLGGALASAALFLFLWDRHQAAEASVAPGAEVRPLVGPEALGVSFDLHF